MFLHETFHVTIIDWNLSLWPSLTKTVLLISNASFVSFVFLGNLNIHKIFPLMKFQKQATTKNKQEIFKFFIWKWVNWEFSFTDSKDIIVINYNLLDIVIIYIVALINVIFMMFWLVYAPAFFRRLEFWTEPFLSTGIDCSGATCHASSRCFCYLPLTHLPVFLHHCSSQILNSLA